jgi:hypothetical protein
LIGGAGQVPLADPSSSLGRRAFIPRMSLPFAPLIGWTRNSPLGPAPCSCGVQDSTAESTQSFLCIPSPAADSRTQPLHLPPRERREVPGIRLSWPRPWEFDSCRHVLDRNLNSRDRPRRLCLANASLGNGMSSPPSLDSALIGPGFHPVDACLRCLPTGG